MATNRQFCSFFLDGLFFGVEVEKVQEVIRHQEQTPVPLAPRVIGGLINLRGQIVTAVDLRRRLELSERGKDEKSMNVVVRIDDGVVSLLVDEIGDVVEVEAQGFEPPPDTLRADVREMIRGAFELKDRLLLLLDTEKTLHLA
jgi:purine-binding chemotaxis protein CheW